MGVKLSVGSLTKAPNSIFVVLNMQGLDNVKLLHDVDGEHAETFGDFNLHGAQSLIDSGAWSYAGQINSLYAKLLGVVNEA